MRRTDDTTRARRGTAFTLVEAVVSIVVVGVMLVGALGTVGAAVRARRVQAGLAERQALALELMHEILQLPYTEPKWDDLRYEHGGAYSVVSQTLPWVAPAQGPESDSLGGTRSTFDDVDDYDGWSESPPKTRDGTALPSKTGWRWTAAVAFVNPDNVDVVIGADLGLKRITVTVTDDQGAQTVLVALRSQYGPPDQVPAELTTYVTWVGCDLRVGDPNGRTISTGASLLNRPTGGP
jgi:MSHA pilin protein MshD